MFKKTWRCFFLLICVHIPFFDLIDETNKCQSVSNFFHAKLLHVLLLQVHKCLTVDIVLHKKITVLAQIQIIESGGNFLRAPREDFSTHFCNFKRKRFPHNYTGRKVWSEKKIECLFCQPRSKTSFLCGLRAKSLQKPT